jgi:bifunctional UDP-N-acetylglucosamine pyrophosphorylase/glucosamine-1-phosphate N-acetyltransferase
VGKDIKFYTEKGIKIIDINSTYIDENAVIEKGVVIYPNNNIIGNSIIKKNTVLEPNNIITDSIIGENCNIISSVIKESKVGNGVNIGPFAYLRPKTEIGDNCKIGDFVEIKASVIGEGTKVPHLCYVGDAEVGKKCNIGCGAIFANYDGKNKNKTIVGNHCFVGSNCNLIAPLTIEDNCFIAAGTTVSRNVKNGKFVIGRVKQVENDKLAEKYIGKEKIDG